MKRMNEEKIGMQHKSILKSRRWRDGGQRDMEDGGVSDKRSLSPNTLLNIIGVLGLVIHVVAVLGYSSLANAAQPRWVLEPTDEVHWFPTQARFSPDGAKLVVNLCHYIKADYCKILEYRIGEDRWTVLPLPAGYSYFWPSYAPDGKSIAFARAPCDTGHRCEENRSELATYRLADVVLTVYPVAGKVRFPSYSPDGRHLAYWRIRGVTTLASGRLYGSVSIYEYELETGAETELLPVVGFTVGRSVSGPRYFDGGRQLVYCGYVTNMKDLDPGVSDPCFTQDRQSRDPQRMDRRKSDQRHYFIGKRLYSSGTGLSYAWRSGQTFLSSQGGWFGFVDYSDRDLPVTQHRIIQPHFGIISADLSPDGSAVSKVLGGWYRNEMLRAKSYFFDRTVDKHPFPIMTLIDVETGIERILKWPNPEPLPYRTDLDASASKETQAPNALQ